MAKGGKRAGSGRTKALTPRERLFAHEYARSLNATQAAVAAGYSERSAASQGCDLLKKPKVSELVAKLTEKALAKVDSKRDEVLAELHHVGLARLSRCVRIQPDGALQVRPIEEWTEAERAALTEANMEAIFEGSGEERTHVGNLVKLKMASKLGALQTLAEHHGLVKSKEEAVTFRLEDLLMLARKRRELKKREAGE